MFLTDGYPDGLSIQHDQKSNVYTSREVMINFEGKMIRGQGGREIYENVLLRLKEITGATIMGFHLAYDASTFGQGYTIIEGEFREDDQIMEKRWFFCLEKCQRL